MKYGRILVPTDFSKHSLKALDYAIDFARPHGAELLLVNVIEPIRYTRSIPDVSELLEHRRVEAAEQIAELEKQTKQRYPKCRSEVHFGIPYEVINEVAERSKADLIIIATHGHSSFYHLFLGSVAERVVRTAQCPVLTVRSVGPLARERRRRPAKRATKAASRK